jgi:hypothetical protein
MRRSTTRKRVSVSGLGKVGSFIPIVGSLILNVGSFIPDMHEASAREPLERPTAKLPDEIFS